MHFVTAWRGSQPRAYELFQSLPPEENGFTNEAAGLNQRDFDIYLRSLEQFSRGEGLPSGWVPFTKYLLVDDEGVYVGIFNLRHHLNEALRAGAGHIGYGIARPYRGRGYATAGLRLCLTHAEHIGLRTVCMRVQRENTASLRVQQHCGAVIDREDSHHFYTRIDVDRTHDTNGLPATTAGHDR